MRGPGRAALAALATALALAGCGRGEPGRANLPEILGEVGKEYLTTDEYLHHFRARGGGRLKGEVRRAFKLALAAELIDRKLLLQEARRRQIRPSRAEVQRDLVALGGDGWTQSEREEAWNFSDEVYEQRQIAVLLLSAVRPPKDATAEDVRRYIEMHADEFERSAQVRLRQIVVHSATVIDAMERDVEAGRHFAAMARHYGGATDLGWRGEADLTPELWETVRDLPAEAVAGPVLTEFGVVLLQAVERRDEGPVRGVEADRVARRRIRADRRRVNEAKYLEHLRSRSPVRLDLKALERL